MTIARGFGVDAMTFSASGTHLLTCALLPTCCIADATHELTFEISQRTLRDLFVDLGGLLCSQAGLQFGNRGLPGVLLAAQRTI